MVKNKLCKIKGAITAVVLLALLFSLFTISPVKATSYTYTLHGPYYEDGSIPTADVLVSLSFFGNTTQSFVMSSNGAVANTTVITTTTPARTMTWNASTSLNYTSIYDFLDVTSDEVNLYIPNPDTPVGLYSFTVSDIGANMINPFLQSSTEPDGITNEIVERRSLNGTATVTFVMAQFRTYTLTFICEEGSYSQPFFADTTFDINLPVLYGAFPSSNSTLPVLEVTRLNSSLIEIEYVDSASLTNWLFLNITHRDGTSTINDYNSNTTGHTQVISWNEAVGNWNYIIYANASTSGGIYTWQITVPKQAGDNPWDGQFDWLGNDTETFPDYLMGWPEGMTSAQIGQLMACGIIMLFLGIGSYKNAGASMAIAWIAGGIMFALGWYSGGAAQAGASGIPLFAFAGVLAIITHMQEKKSEGAGLS